MFWERLSRPNPPPIQPPPLKRIPIIGDAPADPSNGEVLSERAMKPVHERLYADHEGNKLHKESLVRQSDAEIKAASNRGSGKLKSTATPMDVFYRNKNWEGHVNEKKRLAKMKAVDEEVNHPFRPSLTPYRGSGRSQSPRPTPPTVPHFDSAAPTMTLADLQQLILADSSVASDDGYREELKTPSNQPQVLPSPTTITFSETQMKLLAAAKPVAVTTPNSSDVGDLHTPGRDWFDLDPPHSTTDSPQSLITFKEMQNLLLSNTSAPQQPPQPKSPPGAVMLSETQKLLLAGANPTSIDEMNGVSDSITESYPEPIITFSEMQDIISGNRSDSVRSENVNDAFREMHAILGDGSELNTSPRDLDDQCSPLTILSDTNKFEFTDLEKDAPQQVNKLSGWGTESSPAREATRVVSKILNELEEQHGNSNIIINKNNDNNNDKLKFENIPNKEIKEKKVVKQQRVREEVCRSPEDFDADYFESNSPIRSTSRTSTSGGGMRSAPPCQYPNPRRSPTPQEYLNAALAGGHAAENYPVPGHLVTPHGSRDLPVTPMRSIGGEGPLVYSQQASPFIRSATNLNTPGSSRGLRNQNYSNPPREPQDGRRSVTPNRNSSISPRRSETPRTPQRVSSVVQSVDRSSRRGSPRQPIASVKSKPGGGYSAVRGSPTTTTQSYRSTGTRERRTPQTSQPPLRTPPEVSITQPIAKRSPSPYNRRVTPKHEPVNECFVAPDGEVRLLRMGKKQIKPASVSAISKSQRMADHNTSQGRFDKVWSLLLL